MENILLNLSVKTQGRYSGNLKAAIDEAYELSKNMRIGVSLQYINRYVFIIRPEMTQAEINELKEKRMIIGV